MTVHIILKDYLRRKRIYVFLALLPSRVGKIHNTVCYHRSASLVEKVNGLARFLFELKRKLLRLKRTVTDSTVHIYRISDYKFLDSVLFRLLEYYRNKRLSARCLKRTYATGEYAERIAYRNARTNVAAVYSH